MVTYPNDWKTYPFTELFKLIPNNTLSRDKLGASGSIGNIHYGDVLIKYGDTISDKDSIPRVREDIDFVANNLLQKNDVIIADTAEDETVGKVTQVGDVSIQLVGGLHTVVCRPSVETADGYLGCYMNSRYYHDQLLPYITGIKVSSVSKKSLNETELTIPSDIYEQREIIKVFREMDEHIANLIFLIEKKRNIRDGALEDLMSGRTRLDGFHDLWHIVNLKDITSLITKGTTPLDKSGQGTVHFVKVENIDDFSGNITITQNISEKENNEYLKRSQLEENDILFSIAGTLGRIAIVDKALLPANTNQALAIIRLSRGNHYFISYYLKSKAIKKYIQENPTVGAQPNLSLKQIRNLTILFPSEKEQVAIAETLKTMDDEIEALEVERDKMIQIREGAMDDLLTGRVRLSV